jgi:hypothetical protein
MTGRAGAGGRPGGDVESLDRAARVYRLAMGAYPRRWRARYADEVLGVLLEPAGNGGPAVDWREASSLVGNGLLVRVEELFGWCTRRTREVAAAGASMMLMVVSVAALVFGEWLPRRAGAPPLSIEDADVAAGWQAAETGFGTPGLGTIVCVTAMVGSLCTIVGRARAGQGWFAVTAAAALAAPLVSAVVPVNRPLVMHLALVFGLAMVAAAAPVAVRPGRRAWVAGCVAAVAGVALLWVFSSVTHDGDWSTTFYDVYLVTRPVSDAVCWVTIPGVLVVAVVPGLRRHIAAYLLMCLPWWLQQAGFQQLRSLLAPDTVPAFIGLAALLILVAVGLARLRQTYRLERINPRP